MLDFFGAVLFFVGIICGIKLPFWCFFLFLAVFIMYMFSDSVRQMEIGALIPFSQGVIFHIAYLGGLVIFYFVEGPEVDIPSTFWEWLWT